MTELIKFAVIRYIQLRNDTLYAAPVNYCSAVVEGVVYLKRKSDNGGYIKLRSLRLYPFKSAECTLEQAVLQKKIGACI